MADTQRTREAILALFATNTTGQVSAQDLRDYVVTVMNTEFVNEGDFWAQPAPYALTQDKTGRGWIEYSQIAGSDLSFMDIVYRTASNEWKRADVADSTTTPAIGLVLNSYLSGISGVQVLRRGIIYDSSLSARFSGQIGKLVYLQSGLPGSVSVTVTVNSMLMLGIVEPDGNGSVISSKWRFDPEWSIKGQ